MKILHIFKTYYPFTHGGIEKVIHSLSIQDSLKRNNHTILAIGKKNEKKVIDGCNVFFFKKSFEIFSCPFSLSLFLNFKKIIKNFDLLHFHFPWPFADLLSLLFAQSKKKIVTYHSDVVSQRISKILYFPLMILFLKSVDLIIATSKNYVKTSYVLKKFYKKVVVIELGINFLEYKNNYDTKNYQSWKNKIKKNFFLFCGSSRNYKGLDYLLRAWIKLNPKNFDLILAGNISDKKIKKLSRFDTIKIINKPKEVDKLSLIKLSSACILPSNLRSEAFGIFLLEGMFFKKPLISCEIGTGTSFVNKNKETGLIVKPSNVKSLMNAINFFIKNKKKIKKYGLNANKRLIKKFDGADMKKNYNQLYSKVFNLNTH